MNDPVYYQQVAPDSLVYETKVDGSVGWAAYVCFNSEDLPEQISLEESLKKHEGSYVFAVSRPDIVQTDPTEFATKVIAYVRENAGSNRALFWLQEVDPMKFGKFSEFGLQFYYSQIQRQYLQASNLNVSLGVNLNFFALQNLTLGINDENQSIFLSTRQSVTPLIGFQKQNHDVGIDVGNNDFNQAQIPISGTNTGCFVFQAQITPETTFSPDKGLEMGFEYSVHMNSNTVDEDSGKTVYVDKSITYNGLNISALPSKLVCVGAVDPSDPVNTGMSELQRKEGFLRTAFAISETPSLISAFNTVEGQPVSLIPLEGDIKEFTPALLAGAGAVALASKSDTSTPVADSKTYFAFAGRFGLSVDGQKKGIKQELLAGLFGTERISFVTYDKDKDNEMDNDALQFLVSQPAYAPIFPFESADLNQPTSGGLQQRLNGDVLTSWVTLVNSQTKKSSYSAEPDGCSLYGFKEQAAGAMDTGDVDVLYSAPPTMSLPQGIDHTFPMVPYGLISNPGVDGQILTTFESEIIGAERKIIISNAAVENWEDRKAIMMNQAEAETDKRTTPQGFVATVASNHYLKVAMAQSEDRTNAMQEFGFDNPTKELQDALQTNQLFLVGVNGKNFGTAIEGANQADPVFENSVYMAGWKMRAQIGLGATATSYRNVMIFKFCDGSLEERVNNPNRWTNPEGFSLLKDIDGVGMSTLAYTGLSQWLQDYIKQGIAKADGPFASYYQNFKDIVTDPTWRGVIVFDANLSTTDMPPEIQGLAAGIDFSNFTAHHFGFTVSRIQVDKNSKDIQMDGVSSLFGLIDYLDPTYAKNLIYGTDPNTPVPVNSEDPYDFTVLQLQSLFENAQLKEFQSHVQLTVNQLLSSQVTKTFNNEIPMPANAVVLNGSYLDQNGEPSYVFEQNKTTVFNTDSNVLSAAAFSRTQFNTLGPVGDAGDIVSRFLIWGSFDFAQLDDRQGKLLDLLSFGSSNDTDISQLGPGLAFSNLLIDMSFPATTPNAKKFILTTNNMAYDVNASTARDESLFKGFGLGLKSFINASGDKTPADYGFLPVTSGLNLTTLKAPWFGVVYEVTLGGPGALASATGFDSNLLMAWSPSTKSADTQQSIFIGMSLPGAAPGASLFSIEGVFKVAVGSIAILRQMVPKTEGSVNEGGFFYCLRMDDIGIKILGIIKLPPDATIQFFLFGDPSNTGSLGWYAAYVANDNPGCKQQQLGFAELDTQAIGESK